MTTNNRCGQQRRHNFSQATSGSRKQQQKKKNRYILLFWSSQTRQSIGEQTGKSALPSWSTPCNGDTQQHDIKKHEGWLTACWWSEATGGGSSRNPLQCAQIRIESNDQKIPWTHSYPRDLSPQIKSPSRATPRTSGFFCNRQTCIWNLNVVNPVLTDAATPVSCEQECSIGGQIGARLSSDPSLLHCPLEERAHTVKFTTLKGVQRSEQESQTTFQ